MIFFYTVAHCKALSIDDSGLNLQRNFDAELLRSKSSDSVRSTINGKIMIEPSSTSILPKNSYSSDKRIAAAQGEQKVEGAMLFTDAVTTPGGALANSIVEAIYATTSLANKSNYAKRYFTTQALGLLEPPFTEHISSYLPTVCYSFNSSKYTSDTTVRSAQHEGNISCVLSPSLRHTIAPFASFQYTKSTSSFDEIQLQSYAGSIGAELTTAIVPSTLVTKGVLEYTIARIHSTRGYLDAHVNYCARTQVDSKVDSQLSSCKDTYSCAHSKSPSKSSSSRFSSSLEDDITLERLQATSSTSSNTTVHSLYTGYSISTKRLIGAYTVIPTLGAYYNTTRVGAIKETATSELTIAIDPYSYNTFSFDTNIVVARDLHFESIRIAPAFYAGYARAIHPKDLQYQTVFKNCAQARSGFNKKLHNSNTIRGGISLYVEQQDIFDIEAIHQLTLAASAHVAVSECSPYLFSLQFSGEFKI